jgi:hypothetical protein
MAVTLSAFRTGCPVAPGRFLVLIDLMAMVRLEGLGKLKKSTSLGLDPATFQLAA